MPLIATNAHIVMKGKSQPVQSMQPTTFIGAVLVATAVAGGVYWWHATGEAPPAAEQPQAVPRSGAYIGSIKSDETTAAAKPT